MKKIYILFLFSLITLKISAQNCGYLCNGDFESPGIASSTSGLFTTVSCWSTTATDGKMEIWSSGFNGVTSYSNAQFCELNATEAATMYQDFTLSAPGAILNVKFAHRARTNPGMTDSVEVSIGPAGGPYTSLGRYGDGPSAWTYYTSPNYAAGGTGTYRVRFNPYYYSFGNAGVGNFLDAVSVCLITQGSVAEYANTTISKVSPNPAISELNIKFENPSNTNFILNLYDYQGKLVRTMNEIYGTEVTLERGDLKAGIYFYEMNSEKSMTKGKIIFAD